MTLAFRHSHDMTDSPAAATPSGFAARKGRRIAGKNIARVELYTTLEAAESAWRTLEALAPLTTPYQTYDFCRQWQNHIGAGLGVTPLIAAGFDSQGQVAFLLPFGRRKARGLSVLEFLGGKHSNFNVAMWRRDLAASLSAADLEWIFSHYAGKADALLLSNQPLTWQDIENPLARLPHQLSPSMGYSGALLPDFDALLTQCTSGSTRKKMRKKAQTLAAAGPVTFGRAAAPDDIALVLSAFFEQKSARMRARGLSDVFGGADVRRFIEAAAMEATPHGGPVIEVYSLKVGDLIVATMAGIVGGGRFSGMFNSILPDRYVSESPGEQLLTNLVRHCCERGLTRFDLGVGEASYKDLFCKESEALFDTAYALSVPGRLLVAAMRAKVAAKRHIKQNPTLWTAFERARKLRARLTSG